MTYSYAEKKRAAETAAQNKTGAAQPSLDALRSGAAAPTQEQMGHRVDLPDAMREKMENAFGADLSAVKLYESQTVADAGANAVAQGSSIAFAPGMLDFSSFGGQALLGHEISHVVSQARGEVTGGGFLNDAALEARADREGAMAAAGQQVAVPTAALSTVSAAPAAGPMQADKPWNKKQKPITPEDRVRAQATLDQVMRDGRNAESDDYFTRRFGSKDAHGFASSAVHRYFSRSSYGKSDAEKDDLYSKFTDPARREEFLQHVRDDAMQTESLDMSQFHNPDRERLISNAGNSASRATDLMTLNDVIKENRGALNLGEDFDKMFRPRLSYAMYSKANDRDRLREITGEWEPGTAAQQEYTQAHFGPKGVNRGFKEYRKRYLKSNGL